MSETTCPDSVSEPRLDAALAHAERRRAMLQELGQVSLVLSKKIARDMMDGPWHPESRHSPARAFDIVTRSLRLTLVLEAKFEAQVVALCNGEMPAAPVWTSEGKEVGETPAVQEIASDEPEREDQDREPAREGAEREFDRPDVEGSAFVRFRKRLIAGEDYQDLIDGDFKDCVDEIRAGFHALPPLHGEGRLGEAERGGEVGVAPETSGGPDSPTPDFASLRLDPPHEGEGGSRNTDPPPCAPSIPARERAPPA